MTRQQRGDLLLILYGHCRSFVYSISSRKTPLCDVPGNAQVLSQVAGGSLPLYGLYNRDSQIAAYGSNAHHPCLLSINCYRYSTKVFTSHSDLRPCPADRYLLLFRTVKHVSSNYNLPLHEIRDDDPDYVIGNIMLGLDSMMTICRQQVSSSPEDFIFCQDFPSPTTPLESKPYTEQYQERVSQVMTTTIKPGNLSHRQQRKP